MRGEERGQALLPDLRAHDGSSFSVECKFLNGVIELRTTTHPRPDALPNGRATGPPAAIRISLNMCWAPCVVQLAFKSV